MKKTFYVLLGVCMLSCSRSNDDGLEEETASALRPDKAYAYYFAAPIPYKITKPAYYQFTYKNDSLLEMSSTFDDPHGLKYPTLSLSYKNGQIKVSRVSTQDSRYFVYTMSGDKPIKLDCFLQPDKELFYTQYYSYEQNTIRIERDYFGTANHETTTYYFNNDHNLVKSETLETSNGIGRMFHTYTYSDFDNAQNPFKKLWMLDFDENTVYMKSLSANNFRKMERISEYLEYQVSNRWVYEYDYKYDSKGRLLLHHSL